MTDRLHNDQIPIDVDLVRQLVANQFPEYASLPLQPFVASGSSNRLFRLGDHLLVRLPMQPGGGAAIEKEHRWLPGIRGHLPVAVPEIVATGEPALDFGERWSICRWLDGERPEACSPDDPPKPDRSVLAEDLAAVILALRAVEVSDEAANDAALRGYRGRALAERDEQTRRSIRQCRSIADLDLDLDTALGVWEAALDLPGASRTDSDRWYHGDLVAENLLLRNGRLSGVLDFGGLGVGDPTVDLHGAWEVLDPPAREVLRNRLGVDDAEWLRGRAWALAIALVTLPYYWTTMPQRMGDRLAMIRSVLADAAGSRA